MTATSRGERAGGSRRSVLYVLTGAAVAAGAGAAAWPFVTQMNPDAGVRAAGDTVGVDLARLLPGQRAVVRWHGYQIFVVRRTEAMLAAMQDRSLLARLIDPDSEKAPQPPYAKNGHRSIAPAYAVLVGVCTRCGCVPDYLEEDSPMGMAGGYICPCCASRYDPAGRAYAGPASYNLPVPPHSLEGDSRILLGRRPGESFSLEAVERI